MSAFTTSNFSVPQPLIDEDFWRSGAGVTRPDGTLDTTENVSRPGKVGIGITDPSTLTAALDINGAIVNRVVSVVAPAGGGALATAATTVDISSTVSFSGTNNQAYTIPAPTNATAGRILRTYLSSANTGVTVNGIPVVQNQFTDWIWNGTSWIPETNSQSFDFFRSGAGATTLPDGTNDTTDSIVHNGQLGLGSVTAFTNANAGSTGVAAALHVSGAEILSEITLNNFVANAVIGTAATTVDIASTITINQNTAGITVTIPNPTNTPFGRVCKIVNRGTVTLTVGTQTIAAGTGVEFVWTTGSVWRPLMQPTIASAAPTIQIFQTPAVGSISPFGLVNVIDIYTSSTVFTNPSSTNSMLCLVTWHFGELRIDLDTGVYNLALRGKAMINAVTQNNPSDYDRRWAHRVVGTDRWVYTTATSTFSTTITLAPSASMTINLNYDYDVNVAPPPATGSLLIEPSQIVTVGWLI